MPAPRKHPEELRDRAIRVALDLVEGPEKLSVNAACKRVGEQLGIIRDTLRNWVQRQRVDTGAASGLTTDERARLHELERESRELRRANGILKTASPFFAAELGSAKAARIPTANCTGFFTSQRRGRSTSRSATPAGSRRPAPSPPSAASATLTTTPKPSR